jgi:hypothetical protein
VSNPVQTQTRDRPRLKGAGRFSPDPPDPEPPVCVSIAYRRAPIKGFTFWPPQWPPRHSKRSRKLSSTRQWRRHNGLKSMLLVMQTRSGARVELQQPALEHRKSRSDTSDRDAPYSAATPDQRCVLAVPFFADAVFADASSQRALIPRVGDCRTIGDTFICAVRCDVGCVTAFIILDRQHARVRRFGRFSPLLQAIGNSFGRLHSGLT